jgi:peptidoglycan/LPS O-acetylase OafA/YrhL
LILFSLFFVYTCINSGVGERIRVESFISSLSLLSLVFIFLLKRFQSDLLITFGKYSYEIYLIQWPLMYRYDFIYKYTQPFLGTILYLVAFLVIGYVLNKVIKLLLLPLDK